VGKDRDRYLLLAQEKQARFLETHAEILKLTGMLVEKEEVLQDLRAHLDRTRLHAAQLAQALHDAQARLEPFRDFGPTLLRLAHRLYSTATRYPRLARLCKAALGIVAKVLSVSQSLSLSVPQSKSRTGRRKSLILTLRPGDSETERLGD